MTKICPHPRKDVLDDEALSRYLMDEKHLKNKSQSAFKPPASLKFSVYRTSYLEEEKIWGIGDLFVAKPEGPPICGRVDVLASWYVNQHLSFEPNGKPHTRHTDIVGWNTSKPEDQERRMFFAQHGEWVPR